MHTRLIKLLMMTCLVLLSLSPGLSQAAISQQQASEIALQQVPGRVLAVNRQQRQGQAVYQVKILTPRGQVHVIFINAETGKRL